MKKNAEMKKNVEKVKKAVAKNKKPIIIGAVCTGVAALGIGLGRSLKSMKASARAQHKLDKANFAAAKAEARANFEENRGRNTFKRAKAEAKKNWDDAHMSPSERTAAMQKECAVKTAEAEARIAVANARYDAAKK